MAHRLPCQENCVPALREPRRACRLARSVCAAHEVLHCPPGRRRPKTADLRGVETNPVQLALQLANQCYGIDGGPVRTSWLTHGHSRAGRDGKSTRRFRSGGLSRRALLPWCRRSAHLQPAGAPPGREGGTLLAILCLRPKGRGRRVRRSHAAARHGSSKRWPTCSRQVLFLIITQR